MFDVFSTKKFKRLKAKWDKKLAESGFNDIENADGSMRADTDPRTIAAALQEKESREIYYGTARAFLNGNNFDNKTDYLIWENHCEAIGARAISKKLGLTEYRVAKTIAELQKRAKLK